MTLITKSIILKPGEKIPDGLVYVNGWKLKGTQDMHLWVREEKS